MRPGYKPPEDVETYKSRAVEDWEHKGNKIPGVERDTEQQAIGNQSKNAKRREAARRKKEGDKQDELDAGVASLSVGENARDSGPAEDSADQHQDQERQKKIRNALKRLRAIRELKAKKTDGEKLSADQLVKISKEPEIVRDLQKLGCEDTEFELENETAVS